MTIETVYYSEELTNRLLIKKIEVISRASKGFQKLIWEWGRLSSTCGIYSRNE